MRTLAERNERIREAVRKSRSVEALLKAARAGRRDMSGLPRSLGRVLDVPENERPPLPTGDEDIRAGGYGDNHD